MPPQCDARGLCRTTNPVSCANRNRVRGCAIHPTCNANGRGRLKNGFQTASGLL
ncbi:septum formation protein Maf [Neisseria bacilliformis ATCC BAA-1200]|uniref:Septum formation protein Maf n=1 Tax=Neisseria bacilliformis ATCC BAA-1200 TaxID=888742 RepID=F2BF49_9NEIS|nr:septum formation protein Maf [Neisseria bacilliformis ATCC BAA-1200]